MDAEKTAMMVDYLRVLAELKQANVYCNAEIQKVLEQVANELDD